MVYIIKHGEFEVSKRITVREEKHMTLNTSQIPGNHNSSESLDAEGSGYDKIMGYKKAGHSFRHHQDAKN